MVLLAVAVVCAGMETVRATTSSSSDHYEATEMKFGASASLESCSDEYCAQVSIGDLVGGSGTSGNGTATFGPITPDEPSLDVIVEQGEASQDLLTTESTATKEVVVRIRNYLSNGYVLQMIGDPPKYSNHTLATPASPAASSPGTEQFAINAVANTTPNVGADPVQVPSSQMSFGFVESGYNTPNMFQYTSGDEVARSLTESGQTDYTISMIINVSNATPAGRYAGDFAAVVIPVY